MAFSCENQDSNLHQMINNNCNNNNKNDDVYDDNDDESNSMHHYSEEEDDESIISEFAADFYKSGSDYSSLLFNKTQEDSKKLKQASLFQIWGFNKKTQHDVGLTSSSISPPPAKKKKTHHLFHNSSATSTPKAAPFYKKIPGTPFSVDAFRYGAIQGCSAYFLTHFHADHYGGLTKSWSHGPIYCSPLTAALLNLSLSTNPLFVHALEFNKQHVIEGIRVTFLEANHCPGAVLIHFLLPDGRCYLHTGDFRASKQMQSYPILLSHRVNVLYLDTTYCNPKYRFPSKEDVLRYVVNITKNHLKRQPRTLVVVGAYSIGKECVYLAISKELRVKIYASASRRRVLQSFGWPELSGNLCLHGKDSLLHVMPISSLRYEKLKEYLETYSNQFKAVLAFRPTGWTHSESVGNHLDLIKPNSKGNVTIYGVPYSEHSSFTELREFVQFLRPEKIIPTVNVGNADNRERMQSYFREWLKK